MHNRKGRHNEDSHCECSHYCSKGNNNRRYGYTIERKEQSKMQSRSKDASEDECCGQNCVLPNHKHPLSLGDCQKRISQVASKLYCIQIVSATVFIFLQVWQKQFVGNTLLKLNLALALHTNALLAQSCSTTGVIGILFCCIISIQYTKAFLW